MVTLKRESATDLSLILRGLFAIAVVFWHTAGSAQYDSLLPALNIPGRVSVWMFFGLSGYVISHGFFSGRYRFVRQDLVRFYGRRIARILPLLWLCSAIVLAGSIWVPIEFVTTPGNVLAGLFALQWNHTTYPVGVFWTLGVELQFYLLAPFLCLLLARFRRPAIFILLVVLLATFGAVADGRSLMANMHFFIAGVLMADVTTAGMWDAALARRQAPTLLILTGALALAGAGISYKGGFWNYQGAVLTVIAIIALLGSHHAIELQGRPAGAATRALMWLGTLAYGIYAWHGVLLVMFPALSNNFVAVTMLSVAIAQASLMLIERPAMRLSRATEQ